MCTNLVLPSIRLCKCSVILTLHFYATQTCANRSFKWNLELLAIKSLNPGEQVVGRMFSEECVSHYVDLDAFTDQYTKI